ncbi:MAG: nucleotidyltransferase domain-containing protein [Deltaproteobacteria bacterium]|nr:nucleotidyltransferase domain-containing protein [Deltaproteobacteria bacterium]MBI3075749.1 nucleotidyltransferase domain-containing protein [Deltaproteobacteria bacterium]
MRVSWRRCGALTLRALREAGLLKRAVVVLIGSYARDVDTWRSDVDILVLLHEARHHRLGVLSNVHLHFEEKEKFARRFTEGEDYAISAVRYGKLLYDRSNFWETLRQQIESARWPDWRGKISHAERRIRVGNELLQMGDIDAAMEEYLFGATQISRAILLRRGIYPLSRPELGKQLVAVGRGELAADMEMLIEGKCEEGQLRKIASDLTMEVKRECAEANGGDEQRQAASPPSSRAGG